MEITLVLGCYGANLSSTVPLYKQEARHVKMPRTHTFAQFRVMNSGRGRQCDRRSQSYCYFHHFRFYFSTVCTLFYFCWMVLFPSRKVNRVEVYHHHLFRQEEQRLAPTLFLPLYAECTQYFKSASLLTSIIRFFW